MMKVSLKYLASLGLMALLGCNSSPKVAYVRSQVIVYEYQGMKEAQSKFETEKQLYSIQMDSLQQVYNAMISNYQSMSNSLSPAERANREEILTMQRERIMNEQMQIQKVVKEKEEKFTQGVLNQVNSFVEQYGKDNGYDLIFGTTLSGNILYGDEAIDLTKEILDQLNQQYKKK